MEFDARETVLLFGVGEVTWLEPKPQAAGAHQDECDENVGWVIVATLAGQRAFAPAQEAQDLARRVLARPADDGLSPVDSLLLDRRAEALDELSSNLWTGLTSQAPQAKIEPCA